MVFRNAFAVIGKLYYQIIISQVSLNRNQSLTLDSLNRVYNQVQEYLVKRPRVTIDFRYIAILPLDRDPVFQLMGCQF